MRRSPCRTPLDVSHHEFLGHTHIPQAGSHGFHTILAYDCGEEFPDGFLLADHVLRASCPLSFPQDLQERTGSGSQPLLKPRSQIRMRTACSSAGSNSSFFSPAGQCLYGLRTEQVKIIFLDFQSNEHDPVHKRNKEKTC